MSASAVLLHVLNAHAQNDQQVRPWMDLIGRWLEGNPPTVDVFKPVVEPSHWSVFPVNMPRKCRETRNPSCDDPLHYSIQQQGRTQLWAVVVCPALQWYISCCGAVCYFRELARRPPRGKASARSAKTLSELSRR